MYLILIGIVFGFTVSIPPGPVAFEVIKRGLGRGFLVAFPVGCGAAFADLLYASLIFFGGMSLFKNNMQLQSIIYLLGSILLITLGIVGMVQLRKGKTKRPHEITEEELREEKKKKNIKERSTVSYVFHFVKRMFLGFSLGFLNPILILLFITILPPIFADILSSNSREMAYLFVVGLFIGVVLLFAMEAAFASIFNKLLNEKVYSILSFSLNCLILLSAGYFIFRFIKTIV